MPPLSQEPETFARRLPRNVRVLGWASFLNDVASEMVFPLLPAFIKGVLGGTEFTLGVMEGLADTVASLLKLFTGGWSDRLRRRKSWVVAGYLLAAVSRPFAALVQVPWQLVGVRVSDRIGKGIRSAPRDALVVDSTDPSERGRAFGFQRAMDHLGAALGPLLATAFLWSWPGQLRTLFLLTAIPGLGVAVLVLVGLREKTASADTGPVAKPSAVWRWRSAGFGSSFAIYLASVVLFTLGNSSDAFLLWRAGELGTAPWLLPVLWSLFHIVKSGGSLVAGSWIDRVGSRRILVAGWVIYAVVYCGFGIAQNTWQIWVLFFIYAIYYALAEPAERTLVGVFSPSGQRGLAYGWFHLATGIANLPANLLFGFLYYEYGASAAFGLGATLAILAALVLACVTVPAAELIADSP